MPKTRKPRRGQIFDLVAGPWDADATSRCAIDGGFEVRVRDVVPGERLSVVIDHVSSGGPAAWGTAREIVRPSLHRREPPCAIHGRCGACGIQHVADAAQLGIKAASGLGAMPSALRDVLCPEDQWVASPRAEGYRHKAVWRPIVRDGRYLLGGYARGTHDLVNLGGCGVVADSLRSVHRAIVEVLGGMGRAAHPPDGSMTSGGLLRTLVARASRSGDVLLTFVVRQDHPTFAQHAGALMEASPALAGVHLQVHDRPGDAVTSQRATRRLAGRSWIEETVAGKPFRLLPLGFFQVNPDVLDGVVAHIAGVLAGCARVLDLYCGGGVLGLAATAKDVVLVGVDTHAEAITAARRDAERQGRGATAAFVVARPAEAVIDGPFDAAIVDPPRSGLKSADLAALLRWAPGRVVYMSCHGPSLGRDAAMLMEAGYEPRSLLPADMFPQTPHLEWVAVFDHRPR
jgi:23S rRNA (uracil1939-C5)-methyltransferase